MGMNEPASPSPPSRIASGFWPARRVGAVAFSLALLGFLLPAALALVFAAREAPPIPTLPAPAEPVLPGGSTVALPVLFLVSVLTEGTALVLGVLSRRGSFLGGIAAACALLALITLAAAFVLLGPAAP